VQVVNSTADRNYANGFGGGIWNGGPASSLRIINSTLSGNGANYYGRQIYNVNSDLGLATAEILNSTINGSRGFSHDIRRYGNTTLQIGGTILNQIELVYPDNCSSLGYNLSSALNLFVLTNSTDIPGVEPMLGPLQNNGGPTFTCAPLPGSPAIDRGKNFSAS